MGRGMMTDEIQKVADGFFGEGEFTQADLRLMSYLDFCFKNGGKVEVRKMDSGERKTLREWAVHGYVAYDEETDKVSPTKEFYDIMQELLWMGYVNHG